MSGKKAQFTVDVLKTRLDKFLVEKLGADFSRSLVQRVIEQGGVFVNGVVADEAKFVVRTGDIVSFEEPQKVEALVAKNIPIKTLYNNHGLLIIDKPAGLSVHPGAGFKGDSLAEALLFHFEDIKLVGEEGRPGIVHRLDKDTSGVILVARTQEMYEYLKDAFLERKIKKEYIALVCGRVEKMHGVIELPIGKSKKDFRKYTSDVQDMVLPKPSVTEYRVLEYLSCSAKATQDKSGPLITSPLKGEENEMSLDKLRTDAIKDGKGYPLDEYTLIAVQLHTGRTHQIRVHLSSLGYPLVGDTLYGTKDALKLGLERQFLHAKRIEVKLPDGTWIEAESELADDLKEVLRSLKSKKVDQL